MADRSGYIGRAPGDSTVIIARQSYEPTAITTNFTLNAGYDPVSYTHLRAHET